jgi:hypothetical protein
LDHKIKGEKCAGHVTHVGEIINACSDLVGKPEAKSYLENLDIVGGVILK